jgi:hypothetical protein
VTGEFERERTRPAPTVPAPVMGGDAAAVSGNLQARPGVRVLLQAGGRALIRFPGLCASIYLVQLALSTGAAALMGALLARAFARRPLFDQAMAGDLAALMTSFRDQPQLMSSLVWIGAGAVLLYLVVSWLLTAGLIAVLLDPPSRRREVARWFGAGAAANFFPLLRLGLWAALPRAAVLLAALSGANRVLGQAEVLLDRWDLLGALVVGFGPALVIHWLVATAVDYARVDLVRHPGMSSIRALLRGFRLLVRRPLALAHTAGYGMVFAGLTAGYVAVSGELVGSLVALVIARQLTAVLRFAARVAMVAGQVELGCAAMPAPLGRRRG